MPFDESNAPPPMPIVFIKCTTQLLKTVTHLAGFFGTTEHVSVEDDIYTIALHIRDRRDWPHATDYCELSIVKSPGHITVALRPIEPDQRNPHGLQKHLI